LKSTSMIFISLSGNHFHIKHKEMKLTPRIKFIISVIFIGAFMRLIPHWPNFTPIAAIALFGGASLQKKHLAFAIPLIAMFVSDLIIGFHSYMAAVYISFAIVVMLGRVLANRVNIKTVAITSITASVIFFLITNFAAWLASPIYAKDFAGLMQSYVAGLAFFNDGAYGISFFVNDIISGLVFNGVFFGSLYFAQKRIPAIAKI